LRDRLGLALGAASRQPAHDEAEDIFTWRGQDVRVRDKLRVESADPSLMAALAKLTALDHTVGLARKSLDTLMGKED
jgi:Rogdi leucine zipper containing protein